MFAAGVPLDRSLGLLGEQSENARMATVAEDIERKISGGVPLHVAFQQQKGVFTNLQLGLMRVGERTGELEKALFRLADYEERSRATSMKVKSALTYPAFLFVITSFMLIVLPPYMFEGLFAMLQSQSVELPWITKIVLAFSNFVRSPTFWLLFLVLVVGSVVILPILGRNRDVQFVIARTLAKAPVVGRLYAVLVSTRFARAMELQLTVGEGPITGIKIAGAASGSPLLEEALKGSTEALKSGCTFVESLEQADFFPPTFLSMLRAGEESAELPDLIGRAAELYEGELDGAIDTFTNLLEPMIMLFMGVMVGIVVVATMLPMVKMLQNF